MHTKTLIIIRHAKSDWSTGEADINRPLTDRGQRDSYAIGSILAPYNIDLVWCSAATRTCQTWDQAHEGGANATEVDVRKSFYTIRADTLMTEMTLLDETVTTLALVNHQPTVGELVHILAQPSPLSRQAVDHFPTAGVAILTFHTPWADLSWHKLTLDTFTKVRAD